MEFNPEVCECLVGLVKAAIDNRAPNKSIPQAFEWDALYRLADFHSVSGLVCYGIDLLPVGQKPPQDIYNKFQNTMKLTQARESIQHFEVNGCFETLEKNCVSFLPLKGWVAKNLYPRPDMRSMCDIDVLIRPRDRKTAGKVLKSHGFKFESSAHNHDVYIKPPYLTLELHRSPFSKATAFHSYFTRLIDAAKPAENKKYHLELTVEDFYIFSLAHMAKHYASGGTGLRSVLDIYVFNRCYKNKPDHAYIERELAKTGLLTFDKKMNELSEYWFCEAAPGEHIREIGAFIISAGTYGTRDIFCLSNLSDKAGGNKLRYVLTRLFPGVRVLSASYPVLDRFPFLLPITWILRLYKSIFKIGVFKSELAGAKNIGGADLEKMKKFMKNSGL